jgi:hypothetical protein
MKDLGILLLPLHFGGCCPMYEKKVIVQQSVAQS